MKNIGKRVARQWRKYRLSLAWAYTTFGWILLTIWAWGDQDKMPRSLFSAGVITVLTGYLFVMERKKPRTKWTDYIPWKDLPMLEEASAILAERLLPKEPGEYLDNRGRCWRLTRDGTWIDFNEESLPKSWNDTIVVHAPFTRVQ